MNRVFLMGRLSRDPEVHYAQGTGSVSVAKYTLAVDRRHKNDNGGQTADFVNCTAFGRCGEFARKYLHKGTKILIAGRIQTGSYMNKDGERVYTTDVIVEEQEFAESKNSNQTDAFQPADPPDGFMQLPDIDEELPFT